MKYFVEKIKNVSYPNLLIETPKDLDLFISLDSLIRSKQAVGFWIAFNSQSFKKSPMDFLVHEMETPNPLAIALSHKMSLNAKSTSLVEYCDGADKLLNDKYRFITKTILDGKCVKINSNGGVCPYDIQEPLFEIHDIGHDLTEEEIKNFILCGSRKIDIEIKNQTIVFENSNHEPKHVIGKFSSITKIKQKNIQVLNLFKAKTLLWDKKDFFTFFVNGIENGLKNIVFESTLQDLIQYNLLKALLEAVMKKYPKNILNVWILTYNKKIHLTTNRDNIKINIIN